MRKIAELNVDEEDGGSCPSEIARRWHSMDR
jgi:hypothetical protein